MSGVVPSYALKYDDWWIGGTLAHRVVHRAPPGIGHFTFPGNAVVATNDYILACASVSNFTA
jgi:hypothetical protein